MKKVIIIVLGVFILSILSCTDKADDDTGFPLTKEEMIETYDYFISVFEDFEDRNVIEIEWISRMEPIEYSINLGGAEITDLSWIYYEVECRWHLFSSIDKSLITIESEALHFEVGFNGNDHEGELPLSPEISCESLVEFYFNTDLDIFWQADYKPQLYNLSIDQSWLGENDYEFAHYDYQLSGSAISYHLDQSYFSNHTAGGFELLLAEIKAISYYQENKFMIYSITKNAVLFDNFVNK